MLATLSNIYHHLTHYNPDKSNTTKVFLAVSRFRKDMLASWTALWKTWMLICQEEGPTWFWFRWFDNMPQIHKKEPLKLEILHQTSILCSKWGWHVFDGIGIQKPNELFLIQFASNTILWRHRCICRVIYVGFLCKYCWNITWWMLWICYHQCNSNYDERRNRPW